MLKKKRIDGLSPEAILKQRAQALKYACKNGMGEHAQDFAAYAVVSLLEGRSIHLCTALVDFKRKTWGSYNTESGKARSISERQYQDLDTVEVEEGKNLDPNSKWIGLLNDVDLSTIERIVILLTYKWGFHQAEIGFLFAISGQRISKILKGVYPKLKNKADLSAITPRNSIARSVSKSSDS